MTDEVQPGPEHEPARKQHIDPEVAKARARMGGQARARALTASQRRAQASNAAKARHRKSFLAKRAIELAERETQREIAKLKKELRKQGVPEDVLD